MKRDLSEITGNFISIKMSIIYIGGAPKQNTIYRTIHKYFIGCLRNVIFKSHKVNLNLVDLVINKDKQITISGEIVTSCQRVMEPVTFSSPDSYIPITNWNEYPDLYSFSIEFQTTENFGVLAYILGEENLSRRNEQKTKSPMLSLQRDFFSLEIHNRLLNAYFNLGSKYVRYEIVQEHVSDGKPHHLSIEINKQFVVFKYDHRQEKILTFENKPSDTLNLAGPLIIGGK